MAENCCCCPANCGELRPGLLVVMPDAMGLPPGFMGLLALAIGFPRTCGQREGLSPKWVPQVAWRWKRKNGRGGGGDRGKTGRTTEEKEGGIHFIWARMVAMVYT